MNHHTSSLVDSGRDTLITYRSISSTRCSHAEPLNRHGIDSLEGPVKIRSPAAATGTLTAQDEPDKHTDSYKKDGPSAIDKAVHLFFFTEILQGRPWSKRAPTMSLTFIGMWIVMENFFRPPYTIMYPYEKGLLSPHFRGEHARDTQAVKSAASVCPFKCPVCLPHVSSSL